MLRLHEKMLQKGVDSIVLSHQSDGNVEKSQLISRGLRFHYLKLLEKVVKRIPKLQKDDTLFLNTINILPTELLRRIDEINPDIVHLHWVGSGVLRIEDLPKIKQPIVWTLHDMWPFCGSEHYSLGASERWKKAYSEESRPIDARGIDLTRWVWKRKFRAWSSVALTTVSPSAWMQECASSSSLWRDNRLVKHRCIYNGLDTSVFKPIEQSHARLGLHSASDLPILLFGAQALDHYVKGGDLLRSALKLAHARGLKFQLLTFGSGELEPIIGVPITHVGRIDTPLRLADLYNAADIMLVPSRSESFGQVASEALACGTPVLCFDTSGLKDIVEHKVCGYRSECFSVEDFVTGLEWLLNCEDKEPLRRAARQCALRKFQIIEMAEAHIDLYNQLAVKNQET